MRKRILSSVLAVLSMAVLCVCLCLTPAGSKAPLSEVTVETVDVTVSPAEEAFETVETEKLPGPAEAEPQVEQRGFTEDELRIRFTNMLDLNYCYNDNFSNAEMTAICSAISLSEYAADIPGYGIGVSQHLVSGFAESFYGTVLDFDTIRFEDAVNGYVMTPQYSVGTQSHSIVSITETEDGYEVVSALELYYGGDDAEYCFARSVFKKAPQSQFGFNLISCELL